MIAYPPSPAQLDGIYLRLAAAYRRQQARRAACPGPLDEGEPQPPVPEPLTLTTGGHGGSGRGPYRRRTVRVAAHA